MNAALILLLALLPGAAVQPAAYPIAPLPPPDTGWSSSDDGSGADSAASPDACVAPAGMSGLVDQDPSDEQLPWRRTGPGKVSIYFDASKVTSEWRRHMEYGAAQWNKSPCIDARVVDACPAGVNCVTAASGDTGDDGNFDAVERDGYTVGGHIDFLDTLTAAEKRNVAVHEMGHAIGLKHRKTSHVLMNGDTYSDVFTPDATEYRNLLFAYGRQQPVPTEVPQLAAPPAVSEPSDGGAALTDPTGDTPASSSYSATGIPASGAPAGSSGLPPEVIAAIRSLVDDYVTGSTTSFSDEIDGDD